MYFHLIWKATRPLINTDKFSFIISQAGDYYLAFFECF
jgi:hypothetical protein